MLGSTYFASGSRAPANDLALERPKALRVNALSIWLLLAALLAIFPIETASGQTMNEKKSCDPSTGKPLTGGCVIKWFFEKPPGENDDLNLPDGATNVSVAKIQILGNLKQVVFVIGGGELAGADIRIVESIRGPLKNDSIHSVLVRRPNVIRSPNILYESNSVFYAPMPLDGAMNESIFYYVVLYQEHKRSLNDKWIINYNILR